jgi:hypothetical protein
MKLKDRERENARRRRMNVNDCCGNCRFFQKEAEAPPEGVREIGVCRRNPPGVYVHVQTSVAAMTATKAPMMRIEAVGLQSAFPTMDAEQGWCGEFSRDSKLMQ